MPDAPPKIQSLSLENFTAFEKASFDFCPGINVLIGANATGKSHVMKIIYTLLKLYEIARQDQGLVRGGFEDEVYNNIPEIFGLNSPTELVRHNQEEETWISLDWEDRKIVIGMNRENDDVFLLNEDVFLKAAEVLSNPVPAVYLPAQEFLSINQGFIAAYRKRELPYDETYYDLSLALNALPLRKDNLAEVQHITTFLRKIIAGEQTEENEVVTQENGHFKFSLPEGELDVHLVAEGYRKIATLYYLLRNGSLTKDSILFWDEPEANLNPNLIVEVAKVLRMLAAAGMQIFITTHDYLLSHELSLLAEYPSEAGVDLRFFALYKPDRKAGVLVETGQTLAEIEHNPILEEFAAHYDRESTLFQQSEPMAEPGP